jgi:large subunit ribosomal protein L6
MCANAVRGLSEGFSLPLRLVGVGYRASVEQGAPTTTTAEIQTGQIQRSHSQDATTGRQLVLRLGFPRPIRLEIPPNIECEVPSPTELRLKGPDKQELAQFAARIRQWRKPEPYNGKGIFVGKEEVVRKEVKKK